MKFAEFLHLTQQKYFHLCHKLECSQGALYAIKSGKTTPNALLALKILEISNGQVSLIDLLSEKDRKKFDDWRESRFDYQNWLEKKLKKDV